LGQIGELVIQPIRNNRKRSVCHRRRYGAPRTTTFGLG